MKEKTLKIIGYSVGDRSVGIGTINFEIDLGLYPKDVNTETREYIKRTIIRDIWELHDNGDLRFNFSDDWERLEKEGDNWDFTEVMTYRMSQKILEEMKK